MGMVNIKMVTEAQGNGFKKDFEVKSKGNIGTKVFVFSKLSGGMRGYARSKRKIRRIHEKRMFQAGRWGQ